MSKEKRRSEDAKTNFSSWLRQLDDEEFRKREEESMEVNRLAANKALEKLADYHTFEDGLVDQPFLNSDTVKDDE